MKWVPREDGGRRTGERSVPPAPTPPPALGSPQALPGGDGLHRSRSPRAGGGSWSGHRKRGLLQRSGFWGWGLSGVRVRGHRMW